MSPGAPGCEKADRKQMICTVGYIVMEEVCSWIVVTGVNQMIYIGNTMMKNGASLFMMTESNLNF